MPRIISAPLNDSKFYAGRTAAKYSIATFIVGYIYKLVIYCRLHLQPCDFLCFS